MAKSRARDRPPGSAPYPLGENHKAKGKKKCDRKVPHRKRKGMYVCIVRSFSSGHGSHALPEGKHLFDNFDMSPVKPVPQVELPNLPVALDPLQRFSAIGAHRTGEPP